MTNHATISLESVSIEPDSSVNVTDNISRVRLTSDGSACSIGKGNCGNGFARDSTIHGSTAMGCSAREILNLLTEKGRRLGITEDPVGCGQEIAGGILSQLDAESPDVCQTCCRLIGENICNRVIVLRDCSL